MTKRKVLWYATDYNRFCDKDGYILHDIHELLAPWQLDFIKRQQDSYCVLEGINGQMIEVYIPEILDTGYFTIRYLHDSDGVIWDYNIDVIY